MGQIASEERVPRWIIDSVTYWKIRLLLHEWNIHVSLDSDPGGDGDRCRASVELHPDYVAATIKIRDDVPADLGQVSQYTAETWQRDVIHEVVHIRLARLTGLVEEELLNEYSTGQRLILHRAFRREVEPVVEILTDTLFVLDQERKCEDRNQREAGKKERRRHPGPLHPTDPQPGEKAGDSGPG